MLHISYYNMRFCLHILYDLTSTPAACFNAAPVSRRACPIVDFINDLVAIVICVRFVGLIV